MTRTLAELLRSIVGKCGFQHDLDQEFAQIVEERQEKFFEVRGEPEKQNSPTRDYLVLEHLSSCGQIIAS